MTKEITVTSKQNRIAPWGDRNEVREIAQRIQLMAPGAKKLNENQALALAQGAIAHGLDPFNGEIWFIPGSGLMAGIKGLRKAARQQMQDKGNFWPEFDEIVDPDDRNLYMIPEGALAFKCTIRDSETIRSYSAAWKQLSDNGVPVKMIPDIIGQRPYVLGIGYIKEGESTKMDPVQVAMKRAEADALKRRFDLPFAVPTQPNDVHTVEGEWAEFKGEEEVISTDQPDLFTGEAEDRQPNQWEQNIINKLVDLQLVQAKPHAVNILNKSPFMNVAPGQLEMVEAVAYVVGWTLLKDELPDTPSDERAEVFNKAWAEDHATWTEKAIEMLGGE